MLRPKLSYRFRVPTLEGRVGLSLSIPGGTGLRRRRPPDEQFPTGRCTGRHGSIHGLPREPNVVTADGWAVMSDSEPAEQILH